MTPTMAPGEQIHKMRGALGANYVGSDEAFHVWFGYYTSDRVLTGYYL